jgi:hypothetical protein
VTNGSSLSGHLMMPFQLQGLYIVEIDEKIVINGEQIRIWMKIFGTYLKILWRYLPGGTR